MKYLIVFSLGIILLSSCQKETVVTLLDGTQDVQAKYKGVPEELWPHFQMFETEGARRGFSIDVSADGIIAKIAEIEEDKVIGQCQYHSHQPNLVTIDESFWTSASNLYREYVVFHELGHCYLFRNHDEKTVDGVCQSIMNSGTTSCAIRYNSQNRDLYLDELFSEINR